MLRELGMWEVVTDGQSVALSTVCAGELQKKSIYLGLGAWVSSLSSLVERGLYATGKAPVDLDDLDQRVHRLCQAFGQG